MDSLNYTRMNPAPVEFQVTSVTVLHSYARFGFCSTCVYFRSLHDHNGAGEETILTVPHSALIAEEMKFKTFHSQPANLSGHCDLRSDWLALQRNWPMSVEHGAVEL